MGIIELLQRIGEDNISFQMLAKSLTGSASVTKDGVRYSFVTNEPIEKVILTGERQAMIVWIDKDKMQAAAKETKPLPDATRIAQLEQDVEDQRRFKGEARRSAADTEAAAMGLAMRVAELEAHLHALAHGVRSKKALLASPSGEHINISDLLEAIASEAESVLPIKGELS